MASTINPLYVSENAPRGIRGFLTGLYQFNVVTGLTVSIPLGVHPADANAVFLQLAFWINYGSLKNQTGKAQYVIPLSIQILPGILLFIGMLFANESPRYLAQKNPDKALRTLAKLRKLPEDHPYIREEMANLLKQLEDEATVLKGDSRWTLLKEVVMIKSNRRRAFLSVALMMWTNFVGTNALNYYSPEIFKLLGIKGATEGLFATGVYGFVKMTACALFITFVSDTLGRRRSLIWTGCAQVSAPQHHPPEWSR